MATESSVPQMPEDITSGWLQQALAESGDLTGVQVASVEIQEIGRGPMGQAMRVLPVYSAKPSGAPDSFVAKMPAFVEAAPPEGRSLIGVLYANEVQWYRDLAGHCPVGVPRSYWTGMDSANGRFCLLLEDLGHLRASTQVESFGAADARLTVRGLAEFHANWWEAASLEPQTWLRRPEQSGATLMQLWGFGWEMFKEFFSDALTAELIEIGERIGQQMLALNQRGAASATTLVHGDVRLANLLFDDDAVDDGLYLLDWQGVHLGSGPGDLGYFMALSVATELRRDVEDELLQLYYRTLRDNGVAEYSYQQCYDDYRIGLLVALAIPVNGTRMTLASGGGRTGTEMARMRATVERNLASILDNDAQSMLEG